MVKFSDLKEGDLFSAHMSCKTYMNLLSKIDKDFKRTGQFRPITEKTLTLVFVDFFNETKNLCVMYCINTKEYSLWATSLFEGNNNDIKRL